MPVTALDPKTALVVIDMLKGIVSLPVAHPAAGVTANVVKLVDAFRAKSLPVVLVRLGFAKDNADSLRTRVQTPGPALGGAPPEFFHYLDELHADPARDILVHKRQWGAFYGTDLELHLRRRQITGIVLCGISTSIGVESTARDAWERAYNLTFATDAMTDRIVEAHDRAITTIFPRIGELGTTAEILTQLATI